MSQSAEMMLIAGLDQSWTSVTNAYDAMSEPQRCELAAWLLGERGDWRDAPPEILQAIEGLAVTAFIETAFRWPSRREAA